MGVAARFFAQLANDNTAEGWAGLRPEYDEVIRPGFVAVLDELAASGPYGPWRVYRPRNDTRFQKGKEPYKLFIGAVAERSDGVGAFVRLDAEGLLVGTGLPMPAPDQLPRLRAAVADERSGPELIEAIEQVRSTGARVHGGRWEPLVRVPRGFPTDHPRADLLRWKGVEVSQRPRTSRWSSASAGAAAVTAALAGGGPVDDWLGTHVGPSEMTPEERFAPRSAPSARSARR